jgi:hypothetical protein
MEPSLSRPSLSGMKADARWDRWLAKGYAHDASVRYRVRVAAVAFGSLVALGLAIALTVR